MNLWRVLLTASVFSGLSWSVYAQERENIAAEQRIYDNISAIGWWCEFQETRKSHKVGTYDVLMLINATKKWILNINLDINFKDWKVNHTIKIYEYNWKYWNEKSSIEETKQWGVTFNKEYWDNGIFNTIDYILNMSEEDISITCQVFS